ncbi:carbon-nitrogen hydrolase [Cladorrhinum sp. PSN259]|nr:carbon-nitrogen hydrolase [Cladorrhinum sp. PSN259]
MRIACLQFAPQVGHVSNNISRADQIISEADPEDLQNLDLLVLPEMAFSGYNFKSLQEITPYLEPSASGISADWARTMARKYECVVGVGYPEVVRREKEEEEEKQETSKNYNSLVFVGKDGEVAANYRKSFLYYTDETWALEGDGFYQGELEGLGKVATGICMDINPYKFEAPWDACEFGCHVKKIRANLVIVSMAWLTFADRENFTSVPERPDLETLQYWIRRLEPVIKADGDSNNSEEIIVVFANRCGIEDEVLYAGTSTVVGIQNGEVNVYDILGRGEEKLLIVDTDKPPFAKIASASTEEEEDKTTPSDGGSSENIEEEQDDESWNGGEPSPEDQGSAESPPPPPSQQPPKDKPQDQHTVSRSLPTPPTSPPQTRTKPKLSILTDPRIIAPFSLKPPPVQISPADLYTSLDTPPFSSDSTKFKSHTIISAIPVSALTPTYTPTPSESGNNFKSTTWPLLTAGDISPWSFGSSSPVQEQGQPEGDDDDYFAEWLVEEPSPTKFNEGIFKRGSQIWRPRNEESPTLGGGGGLSVGMKWGLYGEYVEDGEGEEGISPRTVVVGLGRGREKIASKEEKGEVIRIGASPSIWAGGYDEDEEEEEEEEDEQFEEEEEGYMVQGGILPSPEGWSSSDPYFGESERNGRIAKDEEGRGVKVVNDDGCAGVWARWRAGVAVGYQ